MHRFLTLSFGASLLLQLIPACVADEVFPVAHNEPIAVRVADGNSGKPLQNQHVLLLAGYDRRDLDMALWREEAVTDGEGKVRLSNTLRNLPLLRVEVLKRHNCQPGWDERRRSLWGPCCQRRGGRSHGLCEGQGGRYGRRGCAASPGCRCAPIYARNSNSRCCGQLPGRCPHRA
jgi:hypothetical protein